MLDKIKRTILNAASFFVTKISGKYVKGVLIDNGNEKFLAEATDMSVGRKLRYSGNYGEAEKELISKLINKNAIVAFIGTHIGSLAIPTAKKVKKALFIEANPNTYNFLTANIFLNNIENVTSYNFAIGEAKGEINFVLNKANSGGSKREPLIKDKMYYYDNPKVVSVPMVTLDEIALDFCDKFDLIFMDIEGSEYYALKGMQKTLQNTQNLIVEFIPHHLKNVAGVTVERFLTEIIPHFKYCYIPSKNKLYSTDKITSVLELMYSKDETDEGIVFMKSKIELQQV